MKVQELSNTDLYYLLKMIDLECDNCRANILSSQNVGDNKNLSIYNNEWSKLNKKRQIVKTEINKRIENIM